VNDPVHVWGIHRTSEFNFFFFFGQVTFIRNTAHPTNRTPDCRKIQADRQGMSSYQCWNVKCLFGCVVSVKEQVVSVWEAFSVEHGIWLPYFCQMCVTGKMFVKVLQIDVVNSAKSKNNIQNRATILSSRFSAQQKENARIFYF
jgi:hypothetical protein